MNYPKFLKEEDFIGVTAPSSGFADDYSQKRLDFAKENLQAKKFHVLETPDVRTCEVGLSAKSEIQWQELEGLVLNKKVKAIICATGGDFMCEMLPFVNWNLLVENPKWIEGYSDPTTLLYILTTKYDVATIYGYCIGAFGMNPWHESLEDAISFLKGEKLKFYSYSKHELTEVGTNVGNEPFHLDTITNWQSLGNEYEEFSGRLIGGCLEALIALCGTKYDNVANFLEKYKEDGFIWYFDNAGLKIEDFIRALWTLKEANYFQYCKGFLFGRTFEKRSFYGIPFEDAILRQLKEFHVPILTELDFGHVAPRMPMINGAICHVNYENHQGFIEFELR